MIWLHLIASKRIGHWTKTRRLFARFSGPESSIHTRYSADFTITTSSFRFSVHRTPTRCLSQDPQDHGRDPDRYSCRTARTSVCDAGQRTGSAECAHSFSRAFGEQATVTTRVVTVRKHGAISSRSETSRNISGSLSGRVRGRSDIRYSQRARVFHEFDGDYYTRDNHHQPPSCPPRLSAPIRGGPDGRR